MLLRNRLVHWFTAFAFAVGICGSVTATATQASAAPERSDDGAVVVRASGETTDSIGAGTVVGVDGTKVVVLTAKHVATAGPLTLKFEDGLRAAATIAALVPGRDLALVAATVDGVYASGLHVAHIAAARAHLAVHVWGSGISGPAYEPAAVAKVDVALPDGAIRNRFSVDCALCHEGDSGAGVFDARGNLVGVFVGYFEIGTSKLGVAEQPLDDAAIAAATTVASPHLAVAPVVTGDAARVVAAAFTSR